MSFLNIFSGIGKVLSGRGKPNLMPALDPFAARYNDLMRLKYEQQLADWQRNYDQAMQAYLTQNAGMAPQVVAQRIAALTRALEPYSWLQPGRMARGAWQMYQSWSDCGNFKKRQSNMPCSKPACSPHSRCRLFASLSVA
jgi:D-alanyl-D-alanine dipeptidase